MKDASQVTACFIDHGLFLPLAQKLAEKFKRVLYYNPWEEGFSSLRKGAIGDGFDSVEKILDFWSIKSEVDLFCFPDIQHSGIQTELELQGFPVWGSKRGDILEINRELFMKVLEDIGLDVPTFKVCEGITALRNELRGKEHKYIKISRWRGDMETFHWRNWDMDENQLDILAVKFGGVRELIRFLVFDAIDTDLEIGSDTYCIDGNWPDHMLHGIEWKDKSYFGVVTPRNEMPEQVKTVLSAMSPVLGHYLYRNQFSTEIRVDGDKSYFIDPTCRAGLPSTASQMELWTNFAEIIWAGAHGELVNPEFDQSYSMEVAICADVDNDSWLTVELPKELWHYAKLARSCLVDGCHCLPPEPKHGDIVGWLVSTGNSPTETLETLKQRAESLPDGLSVNIESLVNVIKEVETAEGEGIPVSPKPMPEPSEVVE